MKLSKDVSLQMFLTRASSLSSEICIAQEFEDNLSIFQLLAIIVSSGIEEIMHKIAAFLLSAGLGGES